jgi:hypothetical protein
MAKGSRSGGKSASSSGGRWVMKKTNTGRYVSSGERSAAARARVSADKKRGAKTAEWIVNLSRGRG